MNTRRWMALALLVGTAVGAARAQYERPWEEEPSSPRIFAAGMAWNEFLPSSGNSLPDSAAIRYTRVMPMLSYRQDNVEIHIGYTRFDQQGITRSAVFVGTMFGVDLPIAGDRGAGLTAPVRLSADFTKAENAGPERESFNIGSVGLGLGLRYRAVGRMLEAEGSVLGAAHLAAEGFGTGTGFSGTLVADTHAILKFLGLADGLVIGYRFRFQQWSMNNHAYNYRSTLHGPYLGIAF